MIRMNMEIADPGHLTGQWNVNWLKIFAPDGLDFIEVDCRLTAASLGKMPTIQDFRFRVGTACS